MKWTSKKLGKPSSHIRLTAAFYSNIKVKEIHGIREAGLTETVGIETKGKKESESVEERLD